MIKNLSITDPKAIPISHWTKVKVLKDVSHIEFKPGLNILWGENGSGKSTLLQLFARVFHAEQGRFSTITQHSIHELFGLISLGKKPLGIKITHDGQGIGYFDPEHKVGLIGGSAFDDNFMGDGIKNIFTKASSGQLVLHNINKMFKHIKENDFHIIPKYKVKKNRLNNVWRKKVETIERFFKTGIQVGNPTMILDEPDRSFDIPRQKELWDSLSRIANSVQLIVATHSPFATNISNANYIEMNNGYLDRCRRYVKMLNTEVLNSTQQFSQPFDFKKIPIVKQENN